MIFIAFSTAHKCYSSDELLYPSIYTNIRYKDLFNAQQLQSSNNSYPVMGLSQQYVAYGSSGGSRFKVFCPKGAKSVALTITFPGWSTQDCAVGVPVKFWTGGTVPPSQKGWLSSDFWAGSKYVEYVFTRNVSAFDVVPENIDGYMWIYFEVTVPGWNPYAENPTDIGCEPTSILFSHGYKLDLVKYKEWYDEVTAKTNAGQPGGWESNGDPPYAATPITPVKPTLTLSALTEVGENSSIDYKVTLPAAPANNVEIAYTLSGDAKLDEHYTCTIPSADETAIVYTCPIDASSPAGTITIPAGSTVGTLRLHSKEDDTTEGTKKLSISLAASEYTLSGSPASTTIVYTNNTTVIPKVALSSDNPSNAIDEGGTVVYSVELDSPAPTGGITISYSLAGSTATMGEDYTCRIPESTTDDTVGYTCPVSDPESENPSLSGTITIAEGQTKGSLTLAVEPDKTTEIEEEKISIKILPSALYSIEDGKDAVVTLINDTSKTLQLGELSFLDGKSKFSIGETIALNYSINDSGSDPAVFVYLSKDENFEREQDKNISEETGTTITTSQISFLLKEDHVEKKHGQYYIFVELKSEDNILNNKKLSFYILKKFKANAAEPDVITENFSDTPVYLGDMTARGTSSQLTINFPAYSEPVDHYAAILYPGDGDLFFIQQTEDTYKVFTKNYVPYASNSTESHFKTIFQPQPLGLMSPKAAGTWSVYWLTAPAGIGTLEEILDTGNYELGYYTFKVDYLVKTSE
jgi:hypothetical protein